MDADHLGEEGPSSLRSSQVRSGGGGFSTMARAKQVDAAATDVDAGAGDETIDLPVGPAAEGAVEDRGGGTRHVSGFT